MKAVVVLLLMLVAAVARAEDNLQYEQAAYQDNAADASEAVAEQQAAQADAAQEGEQLDVESQAVADADNAEAEVEMVEDQETEAEAESEVEGEETEETEGEEQAEEAEAEEGQEEGAFVEQQADFPKLVRHPVKSLSSLAHKAAAGIKRLKNWVAGRQKRGGAGGKGKGKKGKKFPRRLPGKPIKRRPMPPVKGKRPGGVKPKLKKMLKKIKKAAKKVAAPVKNAIKKLMAKLKGKGKKPKPFKKLSPIKKPKAIKHKKQKLKPLRPWSRKKPKMNKKKIIKKKKAKLIKRPPPPPTPGDQLWHSERWVAKEHDPNQDPEMAKLNLALDAVKQDILATNKQINDERRWSIAVHKIVTSYKGKLARVDAHIISLRKEMKALYRKKKQIENLKLQRALETKLKEARAELSLLTTSLKHVAVKQGQLNRSGADLRATIAGIQGQLAKLRGQSLFKKKKCGKGKKYSKKARKCVRRKKGKGKGRKARKAARKLKRMLKRKL